MKLARVIDHIRGYVEQEKVFVFSDVDADLDTSETQDYWQITLPDSSKTYGARIVVRASAAVTVEFYENCTASSGTAVTAINPHRQGSETTTIACKYNPTVTLPGTKIFEQLTSGDEKEVAIDLFLLKPNEDYLVKVLPTADNTKVSFAAYVYEA